MSDGEQNAERDGRIEKLDGRLRIVEIEQGKTEVYCKDILDKIAIQNKIFDEFKLDTNKYRDDIRKEIGDFKTVFLNKAASQLNPPPVKNAVVSEIVKPAIAGVFATLLTAFIAYLLSHGSAIAAFIKP